MAAKACPRVDRTLKVRSNLAKLKCPYIEGLEDGVIHELLLTPGEARMRLLEWIVASYHPLLARQSTVARHRSAQESRIARLTSCMADMGLCAREDYELVKGSGTLSQQLLFLETLTDIAKISGDYCDMHSDIPDSSRLTKEVEKSCFFLDALCRREDLFSSTFPPAISLLPPDIAHACGISTDSLATSGHVGIAKLREEVVEAQQQLEERQRQLQEMQQLHSCASIEDDKLVCFWQKLRLSTATLSQLVDDFQQSYEMEIKPWTDKTMPVLSPVGPCAKRLNNHLQLLNEICEAAAQLDETHKAMGDLERFFIRHRELTQKAQQVFQECISLATC